MKIAKSSEKNPNNSEEVYGFGLREVSRRIRHQISAQNGNDSRNAQGPEGRMKAKNLHSEVFT